MALFDLNANAINAVYNLNGEALTRAFDMNGNDVFSGEDVYNLPSYWKSYLTEKAEEINAALTATPGAFGLLYMTDYHINDYNYNEGNAGHSPEIIRYLANNTNVSGVVFGGDVFTKEQTAAEAMTELSRLAEKLNAADKPLYLVKGNHDDNNYGTGTLTTAQIISNYFSEIGKSSTYYYVDDSTHNARYLFLDTRQTSIDYSISNGDTAENNYAVAEVNWLINTLNSVPAGYSVIVFMHAIWWGAGALSDGSLIPSETGGVQTVLSLYNNRSTGTVFDEITADFTNANGSALVCICGHTHLDYSHVIHGTVSFSSSADSFAMANTRPDNRIHQVGTTTEQVIDALIFDTSNKTLKTIRIGSGKDREFNLSGANIGQKCAITNTLTGCTTSNAATVAYNTYSATITANSGKIITDYHISVYGFEVGANYLTLSADSKTLQISLPCIYGDVIINCTAN